MESSHQQRSMIEDPPARKTRPRPVAKSDRPEEALSPRVPASKSLGFQDFQPEFAIR
jgi:hypothetical protein